MSSDRLHKPAGASIPSAPTMIVNLLPMYIEMSGGVVVKVSDFHAGDPGFEFRSIRRWIVSGSQTLPTPLGRLIMLSKCEA